MARSEKAQRSEKSSDDNQRSGGEIIDPDQILLGGEESRQESRLTQEIQRDYRTIRYLLDRRGRLAISFRIDGRGNSPEKSGSPKPDGGVHGHAQRTIGFI